MSNTYLFLGGPHDGRRDEIEDGLDRVEVHSARPFDEWEKSVGLTLEPQPPPSVYHRVRLRGLVKPELAVVYTHENPWQEYLIFNHLLANYHDK